MSYDYVLAAKRREAARQIASGELKVPLRCGHCESPNLEYEQGTLDVPSAGRCLKCGRLTSMKTLHAERRRRITYILQEGVELPSMQRHTTNQTGGPTNGS